MWIFLITEVLLFSGLFCAYAVFRAMYPAIFLYAGQYMDPTSGLINTFILLTSGLTMALAIRFAQTGKQVGLIVCLIATIILGLGFLGIHAYEYKTFIDMGLVPGTKFDPKYAPNGQPVAPPKGALNPAATLNAPPANPLWNPKIKTLPGGFKWDHSAIAPAALGPAGVTTAHKYRPQTAWLGQPDNVQLFFGIYFVMTGLHGLHVLAGLVAISWILYRSIKGEFGPEYFTPVDTVGLYWGLVDLIWIFLFPLLYLIR